MPKVAALLQNEWHAMLAREGNAPIATGGDACPACGCAAPLVDGTCADCGLQLE